MRANELTELLRRRPFQPFRMHLTTGESYDVRHPELVWVYRQCADMAMNPNPKTGVIERAERVSLLHIVRIEPIDSPIQPAKGNGEG